MSALGENSGGLCRLHGYLKRAVQRFLLHGGRLTGITKASEQSA